MNCKKNLSNIVSRYNKYTNIHTMKQILQNLDPSLVEVLPEGAINTLAERYNRRRQSISKMLRGQIGNEDNVRAVVEGAVEIIREHQDIQDRILLQLQ